jgi:hypothetical protein
MSKKKTNCPNCGYDEFYSTTAFREIITVHENGDDGYELECRTEPDESIDLIRYYCVKCRTEVEIDYTDGVTLRHE